MDRLPKVLYTLLGVQLAFIPLPLLQGRSADDMVFFGLLASVFSIFISVGLLRWRGLPLNATVREYRERVRFLRNEVT
jgi:hypothetical protein